jgi:hypothetical protein
MGEKQVGCMRIVVACVMAVSLLVAFEHPAYPVQRETHEEKEANLKQQAKGGLFHKWTFDQDVPGEVPAGFVGRSSGKGSPATWTVSKDETAPSLPHVVTVRAHCPGECYELLLADGLNYEYPDLTIRFRGGEGAAAVGGLAFGVRDAHNFYAALVDLDGRTVKVIRMVEGKETVLAEAPVQLKTVDWHSLRVQRNTIISKDFIETFVDGMLMLSVEDQAFGLGQVGLLVRGESSFLFDAFHAVPLFSHRPLSAPAAY